MLGGINKYLRKMAALRGTNEFENRLIKASYSGDLKAAKEKHVNFIIDVLKGHYFEMISSNKATEKIFDTLFKNLKSIAVVNKVLSILHRAL